MAVAWVDSSWTEITETSPAQGEPVKTIIADADGVRNEAVLVRIGNLWFFEDRSMYVYYRPTHWKAVA